MKDAADLRVSVVVATHARAASLERLLQALERQSLDAASFEIVVVDDASTDETAAVLAAAAPRVRSMRLEANAGPAVARNAGWRATSAPVVAFTDDDCEPDAQWLAAGLAALDAGPAIVVGCTRPGPGDASAPFSRTMAVDHDDGHYPTCNVFYRREALEAVEGFDESFRHPCGEDTDLAWRVKKAGFTSAFAPAAVVVHPLRPPDFPLFLRERPRMAEQVRLVARHPELRRFFYRRYFYRRSHLHALAMLGVTAVAAWTPWALLALPPILADRYRGVNLGAANRLRTAAQILVGDFWELAVFSAASLRHRSLLL